MKSKEFAVIDDAASKSGRFRNFQSHEFKQKDQSSAEPMVSDRLQDIEKQLVEYIRPLGPVVVAFSGGVDSCVVAAAAIRACQENAMAVIADSPSLAKAELKMARETAELIGIKLKIIETDEIDDQAYVRNDAFRCYHCKTHLYDRILALKPNLKFETILNGANADDLGDHRPGHQAAAEHNVRSPLAELKIDKKTVRHLAAHWGLRVWNKPAAPCLSSRIAYGLPVSPELLNRIETVEEILHELGFRECRARAHDGDLLRIEVTANEISRLADEPIRARLLARIDDIGFRFLTLDLRGFQSGSLNQLISSEALQYAKSSSIKSEG